MTSDKSRHAKGVIFILISALMFGSYGAWSRLIGNSFGVFYQGWTRALIISIVLFPILYYKKQIVPIKRKDWKWMLTYLFFTSLTQAPIFYAFNHMNIGTATLLFLTSTLLTMYIVGLFFLGEKLTGIKVISFFMACVGLYIIFSFSLAVATLFAVLMAVVNGIASGSETSFSKKLTNSYSSLYLSWLSWLIIAITNCVVSITLHEIQYLPSPSVSWVYLIGYAIASIFGFWLVLEGLKYIEASIGGLISVLEILFGITLGVLIFHETLSPKIIIGAFIIIVAAALPHLTNLFENKARLPLT